MYFKVYLNQAFLTSAGNLVTYVKFLGSGMKFDTSESDSPKLFNSLFSSFTTGLNNLLKPLPILFDESSAPFHYFCVFLNKVTSFQYSISCVKFWVYLTFIPNDLESVCAYRSVIRVIVCTWLISWRQNIFVFFYITSVFY